MSDDTRSATIFFRTEATLKERVDADAKARGQTLAVWMNRACEARLAQGELPFEGRDGG